jgi:hypothetical protein
VENSKRRINAKVHCADFVAGRAGFAFVYNKQSTMDFLTNEKQINTPEAIVTALSQTDTKIVYEYLIAKNENDATITDLEAFLSKYSEDDVVYRNTIDSLPIAESVKYESGFALFKHKIPMWIFLVVLIGLVIWAIRKPVAYSVAWVGVVPLHDGRTQCLELDLFYLLVAHRANDLLWI